MTSNPLRESPRPAGKARRHAEWAPAASSSSIWRPSRRFVQRFRSSQAAGMEGEDMRGGLLRQPYGFEGLGPLGELIHAHDLAVAERKNVV
jgi:hypothetical protein